MIDTKTFETKCGQFFKDKFCKINGYKESPEINGHYPDFKIVPCGRNIFFEIYRPEISKIKEIKDKSKWDKIRVGNLEARYKFYSLSFDYINKIISLYIKEKKRKEQLPQNEPNFLVIDLTRRFQESVHMRSWLSFVKDNQIQKIFNTMPTLSGIIFYDLSVYPTGKEHKLIYNETTNNALLGEEKKIIEASPG